MEKEQYAIAYEPDVHTYTVRDPSDMSPARFVHIGTFSDLGLATKVCNYLNTQDSWERGIGLK